MGVCLMVYYKTFQTIDDLVTFANGVVGIIVLTIRFNETMRKWSLVYEG